MKLLILFIAGIAITTVSCKKTTDAVAPASITSNTDVKSVMPFGAWKVSVYRQKAEDKTSSFRNMNFVFSADGTLTITEGSKTSKGTWASSPGGVLYYGGNATASLTISMGTAKPFDSVSKTWNVNTETTGADVKLDNKEPLEDEHLEFVK
jgi:hypothetical protein